jgi:hypothetical protein
VANSFPAPTARGAGGILHLRPRRHLHSNEPAGRWCGAVSHLQDPSTGCPRIRFSATGAPWPLVEVMAGGWRSDGQLPPVRDMTRRSKPASTGGTSRAGWSSPSELHRTTPPRPPQSVAPHRPRSSTG